MVWKDMSLIVFGAILGFVLTMLAEYCRRIMDRYDRRKRGKELLAAIFEEVTEGVSRCEYLVEKKTQGEVSFSRVYTGLWDSMRVELSECIEQLQLPEILRLLHRMYYRFDLINFNMERQAFGVGAAFAETYLEEMASSVRQLKGRLAKLKVMASSSQSQAGV